MAFLHIIITEQIVEIYSASWYDSMTVSSLLEQLSWFLATIFDSIYFMVESILNKFYNNKILNKFYNNKMLRILNGFADIEKELWEIGIKLNKYWEIGIKLNKYLWKYFSLLAPCCYISFLLLHLSTLVCMDYTSKGDILSSLYRSGMLFWIGIAHAVLVSNFINIVWIAATILKAINTYLKANYDEAYGSTSRYFDLRLISRILQETHNLIREYNQIVSCRMLLLFAMLFFWCTEYLGVTLYSVGSMMYSMIYIGGFALPAEIYYKEVEALKSTLFNIMSQLDNDQLKKEINVLSLQMLHENYEITTAGFFVIDLKLLFTIVAAISMYTIILTQFNPNAGVFKEYMNKHVI
ncbi:7tm Chemosensory receptor [Popillia japonica]|uniref:Gustatory receptor n=1 Tax=Popillia japonica TaxID=7064 RepID=A0AAW1NE57_POPJA